MAYRCILYQKKYANNASTFFKMSNMQALVPKNNKCRISIFRMKQKANINIIKTFAKSTKIHSYI